MPQSKAEAFLTYCHENGLSTPKQTSGMLNDAVKTGGVVMANKPDGSRFFYFDDRSVIEMRRDNSGKWAFTVIQKLEKDKDENASVLDPCCGSRKFYFDKKSEVVLYGDIRDESYVQCDGRTLEIAPDQKMDVTALPFEDESFSLVIFDPPHLRNVGESSYIGQAYGRLPPDVAKFLKRSFDECWRVLKPNGTLIFKWGAKDFKLPFVLQTIGRKPLLGNRKPATETYWMVFFKSQEFKNEIPA